MLKNPGSNQSLAPERELDCTELEIHAFVDGELDALERTHVIMAAQRSASIRAKLNALEQLKSLLQRSYADISYPYPISD